MANTNILVTLRAAWALGFIGATLLGCGSDRGQRPRPDGQELKETWDQTNRPQLLDIQALTYEELLAPAATKGELTLKPWSDSYWPYHKKSIAFRYTGGVEFAVLDHQVGNARSKSSDPSLSPAEKYDLITEKLDFPLTAESWSHHDYYRHHYGLDIGRWSWMGLCSGWAPASLAEPAPKNHVLAVNEQGREVLFFNGDIRGLLSKVYDMNAVTEGYRMIGARCNDPIAAVARDSSGRPVDGRLGGAGEAFVILTDYSHINGVLEVTRDPQAPAPYWLVAPTKTLTKLSGPERMYLYRSRDDLAADLAADTRGARADQRRPITVHFYKGCRDVNPASLHLALVRLVSDLAQNKSGFVLEVSRGREVWNHPVWGYQTRIGPPLPVTDETPGSRHFRSPLATHFAEAETDIIYVGGVQPQIRYVDHPEAKIEWDKLEAGGYHKMTLKYTLEFDSSGLLVGGEWREDAPGASKIPDFFWQNVGTLTDERKDRAGPSILRYSLLKQLLECSQREPDVTRDGMQEGPRGPLQAVRCPVK